MSCVKKLQLLWIHSRWSLQPDTTHSCSALWVTPCASCQLLLQCASCWWRDMWANCRCVMSESMVRACWTSRTAGPARSWWEEAVFTLLVPPSSTFWVTYLAHEHTACMVYCGPSCSKTVWSEGYAASPATTSVSSKCWWVGQGPVACAALWP